MPNNISHTSHTPNYINRELQEAMIELFKSARPKGLILSGLVGCGKTTLIKQVLLELKSKYEVFSFTGDDILFRQKVSEDSNYLIKTVRSQTNKRAIIFVDEVQKCESIFDALKVAFDDGDCHFVVSGSNPAYLSTIAKKRLQRRADQLFMLPLSLKEIALHKNWYEGESDFFTNLIVDASAQKPQSEIKKVTIAKTSNIQAELRDYFAFGGLPLAFLAENKSAKLSEIRLTVERGFDLLSEDNSNQNEIVRLELAQLQSQEFTYQNIFNKTKLRRRETINSVIDDLINHGYLVKKKPSLLMNNKASYFSIFSYVDPGIVSYLTGMSDVTHSIGHRIEGYVHARLFYLKHNSVYKTQLGYFKNHDLDQNKNVHYLPGEIDFIIETGQGVIPIEVKATAEISDIDASFLRKFVIEKKLTYGIILYGGAPFWNKKEKLLFWPYWLV